MTVPGFSLELTEAALVLHATTSSDTGFQGSTKMTVSSMIDWIPTTVRTDPGPGSGIIGCTGSAINNFNRYWIPWLSASMTVEAMIDWIPRTVRTDPGPGSCIGVYLRLAS